MGRIGYRNHWLSSLAQVSTYTKSLFAAPATEPVSRTEAKLHCRVDHTEDDTYIDGLIVAAREYVENRTGLSLITQTWNFLFEEWPDDDEFHLGRGPINSITHVKYTDVDGTVHTWANTNYVLDGLSNPPELCLARYAYWPLEILQEGRPIEIRAICGYGAADDVPTSIKQAMLLIIETMYRNRGEVVIGNNASADSKRLAFGVDALLANYVQDFA